MGRTSIALELRFASSEKLEHWTAWTMERDVALDLGHPDARELELRRVDAVLADLEKTGVTIVREPAALWANGDAVDEALSMALAVVVSGSERFGGQGGLVFDEWFVSSESGQLESAIAKGVGIEARALARCAEASNVEATREEKLVATAKDEIEIDRAGKATCKTCRRKLRKGKLRFAAAHENGRTHYHHITCAVRKMRDRVVATRADFTGDASDLDLLL